MQASIVVPLLLYIVKVSMREENQIVYFCEYCWKFFH
jgi:hypothetical protein